MIIDTTTEYTILIGQNAQDNWDIICSSNPEDLWFHLSDHPSSHIIKTEWANIACRSTPATAGVIPRHIIRYAAELCKNRSKLRAEKKVEVIFTKVKNVKLGVDVGSVKTRKTQSIHV